MRIQKLSCRLGTAVALVVATALTFGCSKKSSDESLETSNLIFSYDVQDSQEDGTLTIDARVTEKNGNVFNPVELVSDDNLVLIGEGGESVLTQSGELGNYVGVFTAPVRADQWEYRIDLQRNGQRITTAVVDLRTRPTDFDLTFDAVTSALQASWNWSDEQRPGPEWRPSDLYARFVSTECIYDDGQVLSLDSSPVPLAESDIWHKGDVGSSATIPLARIPTVIPDRKVPGTCEIDVRLAYTWSERLDEEGPPLLTIEKGFANDSFLPNDLRRPTQTVVIESESRKVSIRVNDL